MGTSWHHRAGRGKCFFVNGRMMNARINVNGRVYQWSLGIDAADPVSAQKRAARIMGPVRLAARRVRDAAAKVLDSSPATAATAIAKRTLACRKFADAILGAGGPKELAEFVVGAPPALSSAEAVGNGFLDRPRSDGAKEQGGEAVSQPAAADSAVSTGKTLRQIAREGCLELLIGLLRRHDLPPQGTLPAQCEAAMRRFPGLSERAFYNCLREAERVTGNDKWGKSGRRPE
jgi:hypothetical protein